jgi:DNA polymerase-3 subunit delta'
MDTINAWLGARLATGSGEIGRMAQMAQAAQAWEQVNRSAREVDTFNLDRKPFVFAAFGLLAEAARG